MLQGENILCNRVSNSKQRCAGAACDTHADCLADVACAFGEDHHFVLLGASAEHVA